MLGALLEKIDIPYIIFERTSLIRPLGMSTLPSSPFLLGALRFDKQDSNRLCIPSNMK